MIKLLKPLYGLRVNPLKCNKKFDEVMNFAALTRDEEGSCAYFWKYGKDFVVYFYTYADDILITVTHSRKIAAVRKKRKNTFLNY